MIKVCTLYFEHYNLYIRKGVFSSINSLVGYLQFMVGQKHDLVGHLILARIFPVGQNVWSVFRLVGQIFILVEYCAMSDR